MPLTGHSRAAGKRGGGVRSVSLVRKGGVHSVLSPTRAGVSLTAGHAWADYHFAEGTAFYSSIFKDGITEHTLQMRLEKLTASLASLRELTAAQDGLVALVETLAGESFVVGWDTARFGGEFPLRVENAAAATGLLPTDPEGVTITLRCSY